MKFHGKVGFWKSDEEVRPGVFRPVIEERSYTGELIRNARRFQFEADKKNQNLIINNQVSILSDIYLRENLSSVLYVIWNGIKWHVGSVDINYPRITLELGEVYNGEEQSVIT